MPLPPPKKSTASHFYKYSSCANLDWLKDILHQYEIYLPNRTELNDDNDGLPHLAMQSEQEIADFLWSGFGKAHPEMSPQELEHEEKVLRFNVHLHGPAAVHPSFGGATNPVVNPRAIPICTGGWPRARIGTCVNPRQGYTLPIPNWRETYGDPSREASRAL